MTHARRIWMLSVALVTLPLVTTLALAEVPIAGNRAPDFTLKSAHGPNVKLSELRGRVVLVNFWATWCTPCKEELPFFNTLYRKYRHMGLEVLGVNIDRMSSQATQMSTALTLSFPVLFDPDGKTSDIYQIRSMPTTFVVAKDGTVRHVHWGFGAADPDRYDSEIRALLKE